MSTEENGRLKGRTWLIWCKEYSVTGIETIVVERQTLGTAKGATLQQACDNFFLGNPENKEYKPGYKRTELTYNGIKLCGRILLDF